MKFNIKSVIFFFLIFNNFIFFGTDLTTRVILNSSGNTLKKSEQYTTISKHKNHKKLKNDEQDKRLHTETNLNANQEMSDEVLHRHESIKNSTLDTTIINDLQEMYNICFLDTEEGKAFCNDNNILSLIKQLREINCFSNQKSKKKKLSDLYKKIKLIYEQSKQEDSDRTEGKRSEKEVKDMILQTKSKSSKDSKDKDLSITYNDIIKIIHIFHMFKKNMSSIDMSRPIPIEISNDENPSNEKSFCFSKKLLMQLIDFFQCLPSDKSSSNAVYLQNTKTCALLRVLYETDKVFKKEVDLILSFVNESHDISSPEKGCFANNQSVSLSFISKVIILLKCDFYIDDTLCSIPFDFLKLYQELSLIVKTNMNAKDYDFLQHYSLISFLQLSDSDYSICNLFYLMYDCMIFKKDKGAGCDLVELYEKNFPKEKFDDFLDKFLHYQIGFDMIHLSFKRDCLWDKKQYETCDKLIEDSYCLQLVIYKIACYLNAVQQKHKMCSINKYDQATFRPYQGLKKHYMTEYKKTAISSASSGSGDASVLLKFLSYFERGQKEEDAVLSNNSNMFDNQKFFEAVGDRLILNNSTISEGVKTGSELVAECACAHLDDDEMTFYKGDFISDYCKKIAACVLKYGDLQKNCDVKIHVFTQFFDKRKKTDKGGFPVTFEIRSESLKFSIDESSIMKEANLIKEGGEGKALEGKVSVFEKECDEIFCKDDKNKKMFYLRQYVIKENPTSSNRADCNVYEQIIQTLFFNSYQIEFSDKSHIYLILENYYYLGFFCDRELWRQDGYDPITNCTRHKLHLPGIYTNLKSYFDESHMPISSSSFGKSVDLFAFDISPLMEGNNANETIDVGVMGVPSHNSSLTAAQESKKSAE